MRIAGIDEVGRGPLAGPVVAAAAVFESGFSHPEIADSKKLSKKKREELSTVIKGLALDWAIVSVGSQTVDSLNIRQASKLAMSIAARKISAEEVLVDGNMEIDTRLPQYCVIGGDALHVEISAASILAKVWRDQKMVEFDAIYPGYEFVSHAGYPTKTHKSAIAELGPSPIHRVSFRGVKEHCASQGSKRASFTSPVSSAESSGDIFVVTKGAA